MTRWLQVLVSQRGRLAFLLAGSGIASTIFAITHFRWADLRLKFGLELSGRWAALFELNCLMPPNAQAMPEKPSRSSE